MGWGGVERRVFESIGQKKEVKRGRKNPEGSLSSDLLIVVYEGVAVRIAVCGGKRDEGVVT